MAVSAHSQAAGEAASFMTWLHAPDIQSGLYVDAGGQPGNAAAWRSEAVNAGMHGFMSDTLATLEAAYVRPRFAGFVPFIEDAGVLINRSLRGACDARALHRDLAERYSAAWSARNRNLLESTQ